MYEGGVWHTGVKNTASVDKRYFTNLFSTSHLTTVDEVLELVETIVTEDMNHSLIMHFASDKVCTTLFQMHPSKSPGLDSMSPFFFKKFWHIVGGMSLKLFYVLNSRHFPSKMNFTDIVLIPKKKEPSSMSNYRSVSPSNVIQ